MADVELCLVAPAYNEQECIEGVIASWLQELESRVPSGRYLAIVVDDGSKDRTGEILDGLAARRPKLQVIHQPNGGHGAALLRAYREAVGRNAEWVFHVDSDDQFLPSDFGTLWERRSPATPFLTGYRCARKDALHRLVITRFVRLLNLLLFGRYLRDANTPFRLIQGQFLTMLLASLPAQVFAPNIFLSLLAVRTGHPPVELPVTHKPRETGKVSIVRWKLIKVCLRSAWELVQFRCRLSKHFAPPARGESVPLNRAS